MMNYVNGWMDGGMMSGNNWIFLGIGILLVVLAVVLINKVTRR